LDAMENDRLVGAMERRIEELRDELGVDSPA
jgi:hypothetical protein